MTRDQVCDMAVDSGKPLQPERLERIENGKLETHPKEVMLLSEIYGEPHFAITIAQMNVLSDRNIFLK